MTTEECEITGCRNTAVFGTKRCLEHAEPVTRLPSERGLYSGYHGYWPISARGLSR